MAILGFVEWFGHGVAEALAGCAAAGIAALAGRAPAVLVPSPVKVRVRR